MRGFEFVGIFGPHHQHAGQAPLTKIQPQTGLRSDPANRAAVDLLVLGQDLAQRYGAAGPITVARQVSVDEPFVSR